MNEPQPGIFSTGFSHHYLLEFALKPGYDEKELRNLVGQVSDADSVEQSVVVAFGRDAWQVLAPDAVPEGLIPFYPVVGKDNLVARGSQCDILVWIQSSAHDMNLQLALDFKQQLATIASLELEVHGFRYLDSRDLTGFIDGTENPSEERAPAVALIPEGKIGAGGSFVLTQKWAHDLEAFQQLDVSEQERVIGRTRADSVELEDAPPTSHIRRTDVKIEGKALEIYRRSVPYGGVQDHGLYFLAFSCELIRFAIQLDRMFGCSEDGLVDRLTEFSTPVSGSYWFAPSKQQLALAAS